MASFGVTLVDYLAQPSLILEIISMFSIPLVKKLKVPSLLASHGNLKALFPFMKIKDMDFKMVM